MSAKTVLITGASTGIGKATAELFASKGWNVAATMRTPAKSDLVESDSLALIPLDVTDTASISAAVDATIERFGTIDALINNAGYGLGGPLEAISDDAIARQINTNLLGVINTTRAVLPTMRTAGSGAIVNITSVGGRVTLPFFSMYHATKWGVEGLSESLSYELHSIGVRVKVVEPGGVRTDFSGRSLDMHAEGAPAEYTPALSATMTAFTQDDRQDTYSEPEETAAVIFEAATDESRRLRYLAGKDAEAMIDLRDKVGSEAAIVAMSEQFGIK